MIKKYWHFPSPSPPIKKRVALNFSKRSHNTGLRALDTLFTIYTQRLPLKFQTAFQSAWRNSRLHWETIKVREWIHQMGPLSKVISLELFLDPVLLRILSALVDAFVKDLVTLPGLTSNGKRQNWNFRPQSLALWTVEWKYLYLWRIVGDMFLFLCDLMKD